MGCIRWRTCWRPSRCVSATCSSWIGTARPCIFRLDRKYGARHLKRAIEEYGVYPLANLLATEQVRFGDMLVVDWDGKTMHLSFRSQVRSAAPEASDREVCGVSAGEPAGDRAGEFRRHARRGLGRQDHASFV